MTGARRSPGSTRRRPPAWLWLAAAAFTLYFLLLLVSDFERPGPIGLLVAFDDNVATAASVEPGSAADLAGIRPGDRIVRYAGRVAGSRLDWLATDANLAPGQDVSLELERGGRRFAASIRMSGHYVRLPPRPDTVALGIALTGQLLTLVLAGLVAFKRPHDPLARIGAWLLASFAVFTIVLPFGFAHRWRLLPAPISWLPWFPFVSGAAGGVLFFAFCSQFPRRAFASRWHAAAWCLPAAVPLAWHLHFGIVTIERAALVPVGADWSLAIAGVNVVYLAAGLGLLGWQYRRAGQPGERRRLRVLLAGSAAACGACLLVAAQFWLRPTPQLTHSLFASPVTLVGVPLMLAAPASIAYTILRQRLFGIGLIVRQGVRYALARRLLLSLAPMLVVGMLADIVMHGQEPLFDLVRARGWWYAATAAVLAGVLVYRDRWLDALDRRFFRHRYNAELLLRDVAARLRYGPGGDEAIAAVVGHVDRALQPQGIAALGWTRGQDGYRALAASPGPEAAFALDPSGRLPALARILGRPLDLSPDRSTWITDHLPEDEARLVIDSRAELLVPVILEDDRHVLLVLGPRRSEEPYSGDDRALMEAIAANLALVVDRAPVVPSSDGISLAECPVCATCFDTTLARCPSDGALLLASDLPPVLGGRYRLEARLGAGGMGTVYRARDTALDRVVAVKVLADHLVGSREAARRFRHEAQTAAAFDHPHVVTIHDFGVTEAHRAFLVMERLEGCTLRARISDAGPLDPLRALQVVSDLCGVLAAAHARGLVHRDLKPENVFLARVGTTETTKVLDFGIAKVLSADETDGAETDHGVLVGSVPYMAPEQLRGGPVQPSWDLWALAVTTHEMFTGQRPRGLAGGTPAAPLAPALAAFFAGALAEDPAARPGSPQAFEAALTGALASAAPGPERGPGPGPEVRLR